VINRSTHKIKSHFYASIDEFLAGVSIYRDWDVFFGVATRLGNRGRKNNCYRIKCLWLDIDSAEYPEFDEPPDIKVSTGRGWHVYWIDSPVLVREERWRKYEAMNRWLAQRYGGDKMSIDVSHILRLPQTFNHKYDPPRPVKAWKKT
jgi:hypothetical protein